VVEPPVAETLDTMVESLERENGVPIAAVLGGLAK